jgi:predicted membrane-bound mannosyltransferase
MTPNYFYTLADKNGELLLGSFVPITDFPDFVKNAVAEVGHNLYDIAEHLKERHNIHRIVAPRYYNIDTDLTTDTSKG